MDKSIVASFLSHIGQRRGNLILKVHDIIVTVVSVQCGLVYNEDEWEREWQYIVSLATWQPKNQSNTTAAVSSNR